MRVPLHVLGASSVCCVSSSEPRCPSLRALQHSIMAKHEHGQHWCWDLESRREEAKPKEEGPKLQASGCLLWLPHFLLRSQKQKLMCAQPRVEKKRASLRRPKAVQNEKLQLVTEAVTVAWQLLEWQDCTLSATFCRQEHLTRNFSHTPCTCDNTHIEAQCVSVRVSFHPHAFYDVMCLSVRWSFLVSLSCFSPSSTSSLSYSTCSLPSTPSSMSSLPRVKTTALTQNEEYCPVAKNSPLTGYEPKLLDDFDHSETSAMIIQDESGDIDTEPSYSCDAELDDEMIGTALSSPLFIQEREETANRRQANHSHEESLLPAQSFFTHTSTGRPVYELSSCQKRKSSREMENERIRILLETKRANSR